MKIRVLLLFFMIFFKGYGLNFLVEPTRFDVDLENPKTYELFVVNNTGKILRLGIEIEETDKPSLRDNISIFPKKISVKPGRRATFRFTVRNIEKLKKGKYDNLIVIKELDYNQDNFINNENDENLSFELNFNTEIALHIFGEKN